MRLTTNCQSDQTKRSIRSIIGIFLSSQQDVSETTIRNVPNSKNSGGRDLDRPWFPTRFRGPGNAQSGKTNFWVCDTWLLAEPTKVNTSMLWSTSTCRNHPRRRWIPSWWAPKWFWYSSRWRHSEMTSEIEENWEKVCKPKRRNYHRMSKIATLEWPWQLEIVVTWL